jgi:hypothetical protein
VHGSASLRTFERKVIPPRTDYQRNLLSMMQERERRRASVSTISGKRRVRSLPGRL